MYLQYYESGLSPIFRFGEAKANKDSAAHECTQREK